MGKVPEWKGLVLDGAESLTLALLLTAVECFLCSNQQQPR